jgi:hypothetical protein
LTGPESAAGHGHQIFRIHLALARQGHPQGAGLVPASQTASGLPTERDEGEFFMETDGSQLSGHLSKMPQRPQAGLASKLTTGKIQS